MNSRPRPRSRSRARSRSRTRYPRMREDRDQAQLTFTAQTQSQPTPIDSVMSDVEVQSVMEHLRLSERSTPQQARRTSGTGTQSLPLIPAVEVVPSTFYKQPNVSQVSRPSPNKYTSNDEFHFSCQLAHGSPTVNISGFNSIAELFTKIAKAFQIERDDIIFCTVNTFKPNMDKLFSGTIGVSNMLFVHTKGQTIEVEITKTDEALGVTIADNSLCRSFIKRIREGSIAGAAQPALKVGQLIEKVNGVNLLGMRHYEVARFLRHIPIGHTFTMRLICPLESGFSFVQPRQKATPSKNTGLGNGCQTIRFKATGGVVVQAELPDQTVLKKLNEIFDTYLGVQDDELAMSIWDTATKCKTFAEMNKQIRESELSVFGFDDELIFDMWGVIGDWKRARECAKEEGADSKRQGTFNVGY